ncbi:protocadherin-7-like [Haliotis rufescens]|uniref:protocadherin-7-like n=1 Tax=Haliotis rufescens TaxID=6454 RepID=UPI00201FA465|nr:protocadherin-7-like [Haliotis rufescens]
MEKEIFLIIVLTHVSVNSYLTLVEEASHPVLLGNVANLTDISRILASEDLSSLRYTIVSRSDKLDRKFEIDDISSDLSAVEAIDREEMCSDVQECILKMDIAVQSLTSAFFMKFHVNIKVIDINDNTPEFEVESFRTSVAENAKIGWSIALPNAVDKDGSANNHLISYNLSPTHIPFDLEIKDNTPWLVLVSQLDRETTQRYITSVIAIDAGDTTRNSTLSVYINVSDANDNPPVFQQKSYETRIPESINTNATILQVTAEDLDAGVNSRVEYSLARDNAPNVKKYFQIDPLSGGIRVLTSLRSEGGKQFDITVQASDSGFPVLSAYVYIAVFITDTQNDAPSINTQLLFSRNGVASIQESSPFGRVVALVNVDDNDSGFNGEAICSMENNYFQLQRLQQNEYKVSLRRPLNRELISKHDLVISCHDLGNPPLTSTSSFTVVVEDENDSQPVFESDIYRFVVQENSTLPMYIGKVSALDRDAGINGDVMYDLVGDVNNKQFMLSINNTGHIVANTYLDYEMSSQIVLNVSAIDMGENPLTATTTVFVNVTDKNDNFPLFEKSLYSFRILENEPVKYVLGCVLAKDADSGGNGNVSYTGLTEGRQDVLPFSVTSTGCVTLSEKLDYERINTYEFGIVATDHGDPVMNTTAFVSISLIDENDNNPVIVFPMENNDTIVIGHRTAAKTDIAVVQAYDMDSSENGKLLYSLVSQNESDLFEIDTTSGYISTTREIDIVHDINTYILWIHVSDCGTPQLQATAYLNVQIQELSVMDEGVSDRFKNLKIVTVLVCVTVLLSLSVMTIVCLIKYLDKRKKQVTITRPRHLGLRDFNEITIAPEMYNSTTSDRTKYVANNMSYLTDLSDGPSVYTSTASRQNRYNDVIRSSRDPKMNSKDDDDDEKKSCRHHKKAMQAGVNTWKPVNDLHSDPEVSVLDIMQRHNQVVRSVKANRKQRHKCVADVFYKEELGWSPRDPLESDSGVGGSDIEMKMSKITIPV